MAKDDKKKVSRIKVKKKIWYKIIAPKSFGQKEMGEAYLPSADKAVGRTMKTNLRDLTGNPKDQNIYVDFKINSVDGSVLKTSLVGFSLTSSYVKRLVRKNSDRIDENFTLKSKDGKIILMKNLMVSRNKLKRSIRTALRKKLHELIKEELKKVDFESFITSLVNNKLRTELKKKLNKITPLKEINVRVLKLKSTGKELPLEIEEEKVEKVGEREETQTSEKSVESTENTPNEDTDDSVDTSEEITKTVEVSA